MDRGWRRRPGTAATAVCIATMLLVSGAAAVAAPPAAAGQHIMAVRQGITGFVVPTGAPVVVLTAFRPPVSRYGPGHRGVDLAMAVGGPVVAAGSGIVAYAGRLAGRGVVSIDHSIGIRTTYEPVSGTVAAGDRVAAGQPIGTLEAGHPSCAPASCLHWGARLPDGSYLDPMGLLTVLAVRLLPWDG